MVNKILKVLVCFGFFFTFLLAGSSVYAQTYQEGLHNLESGNFFISPHVSTLGFGLDLGYEFSSKVKGRITGNYFTYSYDDTYDSVDYDTDLNLFSLGALVDIHPFANGFRLTGGAYYNDNNIDLDAELSSGKTYEFGDHSYTANQLGSVSGDVTVDDFSPYIGLGWGTSAKNNSNIHFSLDVGAMYHGTPSVDLSVENPLGIDQIEQDIENEVRDVESDIDYEWYPVVTVGLTYRF
ncbi:MAG: hypothetical protein ACQEUB_09300 [Thermodesulfobacteriota bacterium]